MGQDQLATVYVDEIIQMIHDNYDTDYLQAIYSFAAAYPKGRDLHRSEEAIYEHI